jgi:hypothetical protein
MMLSPDAFGGFGFAVIAQAAGTFQWKITRCRESVMREARAKGLRTRELLD